MTEKARSGIRTLRLPADLPAMAELGLSAFQYPENEAWSVQSDEKEEIADMVNNLRRFWPLIRLLQLVSPALRDVLRGYVWDEDGRPVGFADFHRRSATHTWYIMTVAVLPGYRRRGIGRRLVQAILDFIRAREGKMVSLDVIAGNVPACTLYQQLGFETIARIHVFDFDQELPPELPLPPGYRVLTPGRSDWRDRYELEKRAVPLEVQARDPIQEAQFRESLFDRLMTFIIHSARGVREETVALHTASDGQMVAWGKCTARVRPGGVNEIGMRIDPAHAELAPYLLHRLLHTTQRISPGRRIQFGAPGWQDMAIPAAHAAGCVKRLESLRMAIAL